MRNGKPAIKGKCPDCGTGMYKIGGFEHGGVHFEGLNEITQMLREGKNWQQIEEILDNQKQLKSVLKSTL